MSWENHLTRGSIALARADYAIAQAQLNLALTEVKSQMRASDARVSTVYSLLAQSFYRQGDYKKAAPLLKQAIALEDKHNQVDASNKARDLICLAEIARHDGNLEEAAARINEAVENLQFLPRRETTFGNEATEALSALIGTASRKHNQFQGETAKAQFHGLLAHAEKLIPNSKLESPKTPSTEQSYFGIENQPPAEFWLENFESGISLAESKKESKLESAYVLLLESIKIAAINFPATDSRLVRSTTALARVATRLELVEQAEKLLTYAQKLLSGQKAALSRKIEVKLALAEFYSYLCDFKTSAICFSEAADLLQQVEFSEPINAPEEDETIQTNYENALAFTASYVAMMQKSDLHHSARLLTQQGFEFEERSEFNQATSFYEKALMLMEQIFPHTHLEIAQLLYFKTAALVGAGRIDEARKCKDEAEEIEDAVISAEQQVESRARRLPKIDAKLFQKSLS